MARRELSTILLDVLGAVAEAVGNDEESLTRLAARANTSFDRFSDALAFLRERGLVAAGRPLRLTPRGEELLRQYASWRKTLRGAGLVEDLGGTS